MTETRKLAAILVADVAGYSRLAGADEERTLARPWARSTEKRAWPSQRRGGEMSQTRSRRAQISLDRQHQVFIRAPRPHHVGFMRIGLRIARIGLQHRLGVGADNHHVGGCLDSIVVGLFPCRVQI